MKLKFLSKKFYIFFGFFLSGCMIMNATYDPQEFANGNQSVIIFTSLKNNLDLDDNHINFEKLETRWENKKSKKEIVVNEYPMDILNKELFPPNENKEPFEILFVEPGKYQLESYVVRFQGPIHDSYYNNTVSPHSITFEIKPGEVVYLGDLSLDDFGKGKFSINDSFIKAHNYLKKKHPEFLSRMKKRFINISPNAYVNVHYQLKMMYEGLKETYKEILAQKLISNN